jgi:hypothetical protein
MFNFGKKASTPVSLTMRDTLFGDQETWPPETLGATAREVGPWPLFFRARDLAEAKKIDEAVQFLRQITETPEFESRQRMQAWHLLRNLGVVPPKEQSKIVLGVVVEVGMPKGLDLLAAYSDHSARYWNFSNAGVVWEHPNSSLDPRIDTLLEKASALVQRIGPWDKARRAAPSKGITRLNILTPSGLHFGEGPTELLSKDPVGGPTFAAATQLMLKLIETAKQTRENQGTTPSA